MRKLLILPIIMAFCVADSGAFAAAPRGRANNAAGQTPNTTGVKAARAAKQQGTVKAGGVAARAAKKTTAGGKVTTTGNKTAGGKKANGARAAATQKVLNMGTKVKGATENTVVDEECQNAYYGCMDAFCMLDNASGGRCQCSDRNKELDVVLEEIMKLDQQTLAMATEGVERIQMGENADEIMARVKAATGGIEGSDTGIDIKGGKKTSNGTKARTLDLSAWKNNSIFSEDDDVFGETDADVAAGVTAGGEFANKFGDELQVAASGVCVKQLPTQCKDSASFLQLTYGQRIRSDCTAYENSLKQQRNASQEKLATAQKALRDAALESFQNENKYDFGECVVRFKQCLQTTAECGEDYSGCVADTAILSELYGKGKGKGKGVETKDIKTGATTITISAATYDIFNNKKMMCTSVVKQCVNANKKDAVWQQVIKDLAPVIYTAEYNAASNSRMNCISTVASCVQKSCGSQWDDKSDNYDACLSDPNSINNYCKLEYNRCGDSDSLENVKSYVMAKLAALKVDKCTTDVKECLLSEDRCGPDYTRCIGLDSDSIVDLCPEDKLISCQDRAKGGADAVREYISQIAQGIALNIDNKFATACQNAAEAALDNACGDPTESSICPNMDIKLDTIKGKMRVAYYDVKQISSVTDRKFYDSIDEFIAANNLNTSTMKRLFDLEPIIVGQMDIYGIKYTGKEEDGYFKYEQSTPGEGSTEISPDNGYTNTVDEILSEVKSKYGLLLGQIQEDPTVKQCVEGRTVKGISDKSKRQKVAKKNGGDNQDAESDTGNSTEFGTKEGRFPKLLASTEKQLANQVMNIISEKYNNAFNEMSSKLNDEYVKLVEHTVDYVTEAELDEANKTACNKQAGVGAGCIGGFWTGACGAQYRHVITTQYEPENNRCILYRTTYYCRGWSYSGHPVSTSASTVQSSCAVEKIHDPKYIDYPSANR
ncbi:MAG: hypothetical protein MJ165_02460 [Alphaproteobacteria bacterium]|nr:hypothetical protein [Alphaproteobacteria bacterium]